MDWTHGTRTLEIGIFDDDDIKKRGRLRRLVLFTPFNKSQPPFMAVCDIGGMTKEGIYLDILSVIPFGNKIPKSASPGPRRVLYSEAFPVLGERKKKNGKEG